MNKYIFSIGLLIGSIQLNAQTTYTINTAVGTGAVGSSGNGGLATAASLDYPYGVAMDASGNLYVAEGNGNIIRKITPGGIISTFAGNGTAATSGDGGLATLASLNTPMALAVDAAGNIYVSEYSGGVVRKINTSGIITTVAGTPGLTGYSGDGGLAINAQLNLPSGIAIDAIGNLYIAETYNNNCIRKVDTNGIISTLVGNPSVFSSTGDGGPVSLATINNPTSVFVDHFNNLYIAEQGGNRIRKVNAGGVITTIAGNGIAASTGDGSLATSASINWPVGIINDAVGNLLIAEFAGNRIRRIDASGVISTVAGTGISGFSGDGGIGTNAKINGSYHMALGTGTTGAVYFADSENHRVRVLTPAICSSFINVTSTSSVSCPGQFVLITATGAQAYSWNTNSNNATIAVSPSITTTYTVIGEQTSGCISETTFTQSVSNCTGGYNKISELTPISIYPNPNNGQFVISNLNSNADSNFEIYNSIGELILKNKLSEHQTAIHLNNTASGIYYIKYIDASGVSFTNKISVQ